MIDKILNARLEQVDKYLEDAIMRKDLLETRIKSLSEERGLLAALMEKYKFSLPDVNSKNDPEIEVIIDEMVEDVSPQATFNQILPQSSNEIRQPKQANVKIESKNVEKTHVPQEVKMPRYFDPEKCPLVTEGGRVKVKEVEDYLIKLILDNNNMLLFIEIHKHLASEHPYMKAAWGNNFDSYLRNLLSKSQIITTTVLNGDGKTRYYTVRKNYLASLNNTDSSNYRNETQYTHSFETPSNTTFRTENYPKTEGV